MAEPFGLVIGGVFLAALLGLIVLVLDPFGPAEPVVGVVRFIGHSSAKGGRPLIARVDLPDGRTVAVGLDGPTMCEVGRPVRLLKTKRPWGAWIRAAPDPCPVTSG